MEKVQIKNVLEPHVLIFPIPFQGPVNCALKLVELLCLSGIHVTFLNTNHIHRPLLRHSHVLSRFNRYPNLQFQTIPNGLEDEDPVTGDRFEEVMEAIDAVTKPLFREIMISGSLSSRSERPVTLMIPDEVYSFVVEVATETLIPVFYFATISPWCLWTSHFNLAKLIEADHVPVKETDLEELVKDVLGTENILRKRDLAAFCRISDISDHEVQRTLQEARTLPRAQGLILNTFEELDYLILEHIRKLCPNIYSIGALHALHKARIMAMAKSSETTLSYSVWKEDRTGLSWLDKHPPKTVVYVSIGIWHGLVNSGKPFLWVRRPWSIIGGYDESRVPSDLLETTKEMGCIVDWAP